MCVLCVRAERFCPVLFPGSAQDSYEELVQMVGCRRGELTQEVALKARYERALQDLAELVHTAQDKMAADQKMSVGSVIEVQVLLDKHKVRVQQNLRVHQN